MALCVCVCVCGVVSASVGGFGAACFVSVWVVVGWWCRFSVTALLRAQLTSKLLLHEHEYERYEHEYEHEQGPLSKHF